MKRTWLGLAVLVGLSLGFGCGGDDPAPTDTGTGGTTSGTGGTTSGTGGTTATGGTVATVMCGNQTCPDPTGGLGTGLVTACCDTTTMMCGATNPTDGTCSAKPAFEGCPSLNYDQIAAPCCTDEANPSTGLCGFAFFGGACTATTTAGMTVPGLPITLPDPQYCDGTPADPADLVDAGTGDADGGV